MIAGIYLIRNIINNKCYIGSSYHTDKREKEHFGRLYNNKHHNIHLQNSYNKYGKDNFKFYVIEIVDEKDFNKNFLLEREQY